MRAAISSCLRLFNSAAASSSLTVAIWSCCSLSSVVTNFARCKTFPNSWLLLKLLVGNWMLVAILWATVVEAADLWLMPPNQALPGPTASWACEWTQIAPHQASAYSSRSLPSKQTVRAPFLPASFSLKWHSSPDQLHHTATTSSSNNVNSFSALVSTLHSLAVQHISKWWNQSFASPSQNTLVRLMCQLAIRTTVCYQCNIAQSASRVTQGNSEKWTQSHCTAGCNTCLKFYCACVATFMHNWKHIMNTLKHNTTVKKVHATHVMLWFA